MAEVKYHITEQQLKKFTTMLVEWGEGENLKAEELCVLLHVANLWFQEKTGMTIGGIERTNGAEA